MQAAQLANNKRRRDQFENASGITDSKHGQRTEITDPHILDKLKKAEQDVRNNLVKGSTKMEVKSLLQWHLSPHQRSTRLRFASYQRDHTVGWNDAQKSQYIFSIYCGRASVPFVANTVKAHARLIDGGHRLDAIVGFIQGEIAMNICGEPVYYSQLPPKRKFHFDSMQLWVMEYQGLSLKNEVEIYMQLNSGLTFTAGERLHATRRFNPITRLADAMIEDAQNDTLHPINQLCAVRMDCGGKHRGRKNELLIMSYIMHQCIYRMTGDEIQTALTEAFIEAVCDWNKDSAKAMKDFLLRGGKTLDQKKEEVMSILRGILELYNALSAVTISGQTDWRRLVICVLAVAEKLDLTAFAKFVADVVARPSLSIFAGRGEIYKKHMTQQSHLKKEDVKDLVEAFGKFRDAQPVGGTVALVVPPPPSSDGA